MRSEKRVLKESTVYKNWCNRLKIIIGFKQIKNSCEFNNWGWVPDTPDKYKQLELYYNAELVSRYLVAMLRKDTISYVDMAKTLELIQKNGLVGSYISNSLYTTYYKYRLLNHHPDLDL